MTKADTCTCPLRPENDRFAAIHERPTNVPSSSSHQQAFGCGVQYSFASMIVMMRSVTAGSEGSGDCVFRLLEVVDFEKHLVIARFERTGIVFLTCVGLVTKVVTDRYGPKDSLNCFLNYIIHEKSPAQAPGLSQSRRVESAVIDYSMTCTMRCERGSTSTVRSLTTV